MNAKQKAPAWMVFLVVVATAALSLWVIGGRTWPPRLLPALNEASAQQPASAALFSGGLRQPARSVLPVAATQPAPVIRAGTASPHIERGTCTSCHTVTAANGGPIPAISSQAAPTHNWRGVCMNCHTVKLSTAPLTPAATTAPPAPAAAPAAPPEGEWLGLEVAPLTAVTAAQFKLPKNAKGIVVAEAEAQAALAGVLAGDLVLGINGRPTTNMQGFLDATDQGKLAAGQVVLSRKGRQLSVRLESAGPAAGAAAPAPGAAAPGVTPNVSAAPALPNTAPVGQQAAFARQPGAWGAGTAPQQATAPTRGPTGEPAWLGIEVVPLSPVVATQYGIPAGIRGLVVTRVGPRAAAAGIQLGDVVVAVNGAPVDDMRSFFDLTGRGALRGAVITILRGGTPVRVVM